MADDGNTNKPFDDYVHSSTDENITNLIQSLNTKIGVPTGAANGDLLNFNSSLNAWRPVTYYPTLSRVTAVATSNLTTSTTTTDVPGASVTLTAGVWAVWGLFSVVVSVASAGANVRLRLTNGTATALFSTLGLKDIGATTTFDPSMTFGVFSSTGAQTVTLSAEKSGAVGTVVISGAVGSESGLLAIKLSN